MAVFMHSIAIIMMPPMIIRDLSATDKGSEKAAIMETHLRKPIGRYFAQWLKRGKSFPGPYCSLRYVTNYPYKHRMRPKGILIYVYIKLSLRS